MLLANEIDQAKLAGSLFARSETNAQESFEIYSRVLTEEITFEKFESFRIEWVNGYCEAKPNVKGDSANQAFKRFKTRLFEKFHIEIVKPDSDNLAAQKKAKERKEKKEKLMESFEDVSTSELKGKLSMAFKTLADNPDSKVAGKAVDNLKAVIKERTKDESATLKAELSEKRSEIRGLLSGCHDVERLDAVIDILSPDNDVMYQ
jgi:hypothetical protein